MSSRIGLRLSQFARAARVSMRKPTGRRFQVTDATTAPPAPGAFQRMWNSPVGVKTVHFWAPVMKWAIVLAGVSDFARPAQDLSLSQNLALTATGAIWTRWCFVIKPKNMLLAAVNFLLCCVGVTQVSRIFMYQSSMKNADLPQVANADAKDAKNTVVEVVEDPEGAVKKSKV